MKRYVLTWAAVLLCASCSEPEVRYEPSADMQAADMGEDGGEDAGEDMEPAPACEPACADATPICDEDEGVCVGCLEDDHCSGDTPVCDTEANTCVGCLTGEDCSGDAPVCDTGSNTCVGCLADEDCSGDTPVCDTGSNTCVGCLADEDCSGDTPVCDAESNTCVGCLEDADCTSPEASRCDTGTKSCAACEEASQCAHLGLNQCVGGACKECTAATEAEDCGEFACLPDNTCGDTERGTLNDCEPCQADSECKAPSRCVTMNFGDPAQPHGSYCLRPFAETCEQPYRVILEDRESVSGAPAEDYCGLYEVNTTCEALDDLFMAKDCATDDDCGVQGLDDGLCRPSSDMTLECTIGCDRQTRCLESQTCDTHDGGAENYCR